MIMDPRIIAAMRQATGEDPTAHFNTVVGRGGRTDENRPVLDNGELNLGRSIPAPGRTGNTFLLPGYGVPVRVLELRGDSKLAQWITVTFNILPIDAASVTAGASLPFGPLVGIVEFGNGSAFSQVEIDIQPGGTLSTITGGAEFVNAFTLPFGGSSISAPGSSFRIFVRNDAGYQPTGDGNTIGNLTNVPTVMAHVSYGQKPAAEPNTRTLWVTSPIGGGVGFNNAVGVPPFARSVYLYRTNITTTGLSVTVQEQYGSTLNGPILIPAGVDGSAVPIRLSALSRVLQVTNLGPDPSIIRAVFNVQI